MGCNSTLNSRHIAILRREKVNRKVSTARAQLRSLHRREWGAFEGREIQTTLNARVSGTQYFAGFANHGNSDFPKFPMN
jgi:hypothetical protein